MEELRPWLAETYDVDPAQTSLAGKSLGGLFVRYTLFSQPQSFQRFVAIGPAIWWADRLVLGLLKNAAGRIKDLDVKVFLAVGALEEAADAQAKMVSNLEELMRDMAALGVCEQHVRSEILAGESHMSVFGPALSRALGSLFPAQSRDESWATLGAEDGGGSKP